MWQNQIQPTPSHKLSPTQSNRRKTPTQGCWLYPKKHRQEIISEQQIPKKQKTHTITSPTMKTKITGASNY